MLTVTCFSMALASPAFAAVSAATSTVWRITVPELACVLSFAYLSGSFLVFWVAARTARSASAELGSPPSWAIRFLRSPLPLVPLCVAYLALLAASWSPDTLSLMMPGSLEEGLATGKPQFFPQLDGIMTLLSRRTTSASAWLHIACINFFAGRHAALKAVEKAMPVAHTLLLTLVTGPLGLCSHVVTQAVMGRRGGDARGPGFGGGKGGPGGYGRAYGYSYGYAYGYAYGGDGGDAWTPWVTMGKV